MAINTRLEADRRPAGFESTSGRARFYLVTRQGGEPSSSDRLRGGKRVKDPGTKVELTTVAPPLPKDGRQALLSTLKPIKVSGTGWDESVKPSKAAF